MALPYTTNLAAWYDASQITGFADGATLSGWSDLSGNGFNLEYAATSYPVYYKTTAAYLVNGLPTVYFGGSNNAGLRQGTASTVVTSPNTALVVYKTTTASGNGDQRIFDANGGGARELFDVTTPTYTIYAGSGSVTGGVPTVGLHYATIIVNGASTALRVDGSTITLSGGSPGTGGIFGLTLGTDSSSAWMEGVLCEVIFYDAALSSTNYGLLETYLYNKWISTPVVAARTEPLVMII